jgi:hypothetical protein
LWCIFYGIPVLFIEADDNSKRGVMPASNYNTISSQASKNSRNSNSSYGASNSSYDDENEAAAAAAAANITPAQYRRRKMLGGQCQPRIALLSGFLLILCAFFTILLLAMHSAQRLRHKSGLDGSSSASSDRSVRRHAINAYYALESGLNNGKQSDALKEGCEATIMLMRHCEKGPHTKGHCSYVGYERSHFIASLFDTPKDQSRRWPKPSYLYATKVTRIGVDHDVYREIDTLTPLSLSTNVPIEYENFGETGVNLAAHIHAKLRSGEMCGKLAVVSWKHELIPGLAEKLGCGPLNGCPMSYADNEYDAVWQLKFVYSPPKLWETEPPPRIIFMPNSGDNSSSPLNITSIDHPVMAENADEPISLNKSKTKKDSTVANGASRVSSTGIPMEEQVEETSDRRALTSSSSRQWFVFATVQKQGFDPLAWSKQAHDYPPGGTKRGARWAKEL